MQILIFYFVIICYRQLRMYRNRQEAQSHESSPSQPRRYRIERNNSRDEEVVVPYWDEPSSSAYHMHEEIRLLKMKNMHFQEHMDRMMLEYEELKKTLEMMDEMEKEHIRKNSELSHRLSLNLSKMQEMKSQIEIIKYENEELKSDIKSYAVREVDYKTRISKLREEEAKLNTTIARIEEDNNFYKAAQAEKIKAIEKSYEVETSNLRKQLDSCSDSYSKIKSDLISAKLESQQKSDEMRKLSIEHEEQKKIIMSKKQEDIQRLKQELTLEFERVTKEEEVKRSESKDQLMKCMKMEMVEEGQKMIEKIQMMEMQKEELREKNEEDSKKCVMVQNQNIELRNQIERIKTELEEKQAEIRKFEAEMSEKKENKQEESNRKEQISGQNQIYQGQINNDEQANDSQNKPNYDQIIHDLQLELDSLTNETIKLKKIDAQKDSIIDNFNSLVEENKEKIESLQREIQALTKQAQMREVAEPGRKENEETVVVREDNQKENAQMRNNQDEKGLSELEAEYNCELQSLRRLILYKTNSQSKQTQPSVIEIERKVRREEQSKFDSLVREYKNLQRELLSLQQELMKHPQGGERDVITFRNSEEQRRAYIEAIQKWELAYEQLHAVYEAKMISKDEEINLLNLRLANSGTFL